MTEKQEPMLLKFSDEMLETILRLVRELPTLVKEGKADIKELFEDILDLNQICREAHRLGGIRGHFSLGILVVLVKAVIKANDLQAEIPDLIKKVVESLKPYVPEVER